MSCTPYLEMKDGGWESYEFLGVSHSPVPFTLAGHRNHPACVVVSPSSAAAGGHGFARGKELVTQPSCDGDSACPHRHVAFAILDQLLPGWQNVWWEELDNFLRHLTFRKNIHRPQIKVKLTCVELRRHFLNVEFKLSFPICSVLLDGQKQFSIRWNFNWTL